MAKKSFFWMFLILIVGFALRFWCLDKPQGLWNDEYIGWFISSRSFPSEFIQEAIKNCHMPFYYVYLKIWMSLFGDADFSLRLSSVLSGILSVFVMYLVGREYKDEKTGLLCAAFAAVSGFLIYFSQEVRLYSLLFLLSSINLFVWLRLSREQTKLNFFCFGAANFLIIITHTLGFVFSFFNFLFLGLYLLKVNKKFALQIIILTGILLVSLLPFAPFVYRIFKESYVSQFWSGFSLAKVFFVFSDYFSPIQINVINTPKYISEVLIKNSKINYMFLIFAIIPLAIGAFGVLRGLFSQDSKLKYLFWTSFSYFSVLLIAAMFNRIVLSTKYSVEIYPVLILLMIVGLLSLRQEKIRNALIALILLLPLLHYSVNNNSTPKLGRSEGNKIVIDLLQSANIKSSDTVVLTYYDAKKFEKYIGKQKYKMFWIDKYNFTGYIVPQDYTYKTIVINGKILFYDNLKLNDTKLFEQKFYNNFIKNMKKGDKLAIVVLKTVSFFNEKQMKEITSKPTTYYDTPFLFMVFSYVKNNSVAISSKYLKPKQVLETGDWAVIVFEKQ